MAQKRIRLKDIADALGIHITTVSKALKNHSMISEETRKLVEETARKMEYHPDPFMSQLASYRTQNKSIAYKGTIAWVSNIPQLQYPSDIKAYFSGAKQEAVNRGFKISEFCINNDFNSLDQISRIIRARGIQGVIFALETEYLKLESKHWEDLFLVSIGNTVFDPPLNMVSVDLIRNYQLIVKQISLMGHKRIGCFRPTIEKCHLDNFIKHFCTDCQILYSHAESKSEFLEWVHEEKIEVLISDHSEHKEWLIENQYKIPEHIGWINPSLAINDENSGVQSYPGEIGREAVNLLNNHINTNKHGFPKNPARMLVSSQWNEGLTTKAIGNPTSIQPKPHRI